ncbi:hypothetical protein C0Z19_13020 [Trinickia soli]|uniref:Uncharacterized protein n=1 Tax=Trinickia soli TaxID=380675 RepID=A0A2N7W5P3_9BURK|nr:hypothetical protein C0Z19_13020 [Trinickia soli]
MRNEPALRGGLFFALSSYLFVPLRTYPFRRLGRLDSPDVLDLRHDLRVIRAIRRAFPAAGAAFR